MPVANQNEDQHQCADDQETGGFVIVDVGLVMLPGRPGVGLRFRGGSRHDDIVAPRRQLWNSRLRC